MTDIYAALWGVMFLLFAHNAAAFVSSLGCANC
jgi:hypothetical protein